MPVQLEPETTALVIIDMQEWVVNPASAFCRYAEKRSPGLLDFFLPHVDDVVIPKLRPLVDVFREHRLQIIYTTGTRSWSAAARPTRIA